MSEMKMLISKYPKQAPCKDCTDRHPDCHSSCELYRQYASDKKQYLAETYAADKAAHEADDILVKGALRTIKKHNSAKQKSKM